MSWIVYKTVFRLKDCEKILFIWKLNLWVNAHSRLWYKASGPTGSYIYILPKPEIKSNNITHTHTNINVCQNKKWLWQVVQKKTVMKKV